MVRVLRHLQCSQIFVTVSGVANSASLSAPMLLPEMFSGHCLILMQSGVTLHCLIPIPAGKMGRVFRFQRVDRQ